MWSAMREGTFRRLYYNYLWRHLKFTFKNYITKFEILKHIHLIKQNVNKIFSICSVK